MFVLACVLIIFMFGYILGSMKKPEQNCSKHPDGSVNCIYNYNR